MTDKTQKFGMKHLAAAIALTCLLMAAAHFAQPPVGDAAQNTPLPDSAEFAGKYVTVYLSDPESGMGQILTNVELITIGGRTMLVGTGADTGQQEDWTAGVRIGIAWDTVQIYYAMTQQQFEEKMKEHGPEA